MSTVARDKSTSKSKLTALFTVRRWLREFPCTSAESYVLFALAAYAQPDGTDVHPGVGDLERITKFDRSTIIDALKFWRALAAITRVKCGCRQRREADEYRINLDWQPSKVVQDDLSKSRRQRLMNPHKSDANFHKSDTTRQKSARTTPSEKTLSEKSFITEKPKPTSPISPSKEGDCQFFFWWKKTLIAVPMGRRRRLPNFEKCAGRSPEQVLDFLAGKGFTQARVVTEPIVMPERVPDLTVLSRDEKNLMAFSAPSAARYP